MKGARLFATALASVLITVANAHASARAELMANEVDRAELVADFDPAKLPKKTADGRTVPRSRGACLGNVLQKMHDRGELPPCELRFPTVKTIAVTLANLDQGDGCWAGLSRLARETNYAERTIREACEYLRDEVGVLLMFSRISVDDRRVGGARWPLTGQRSTVRKMLVVPRGLELTDDELLDLVAYGEAAPVAKLAEPLEDAKPEAPPAPARAPKVAELRLELRGLVAPLDAIAELTGHRIPAEWVATESVNAKLEATHTVDAMAELANDLRGERDGAAAMHEAPEPMSSKRLRARVLKYLEGKRTWLDKGGERAKLGAEARGREAGHEARKARERVEDLHAAKRLGLDAPRAPAPAVPEHITREVRKLVVEQMVASPERKAELQKQIDALLASTPPPD